MKYLLFLTLLISNLTFAQSISGTIKSETKVPEGALYVFAKKFNSKMPMPIAVKKIENPKFPLKFKLSSENVMMKQMKFIGPFKITARISPSGLATDKSGVEVSTVEKVALDQKDVELTFK